MEFHFPVLVKDRLEGCPTVAFIATPFVCHLSADANVLLSQSVYIPQFCYQAHVVAKTGYSIYPVLVYMSDTIPFPTGALCI